jgi:hypothetical protein
MRGESMKGIRWWWLTPYLVAVALVTWWFVRLLETIR